MMLSSQLDERAVARVAGPAWSDLRPAFDAIVQALLSVSPTAKGELTTIYVKFSAPETSNRPYAVLWLRKSSEMTLGLALPAGIHSATFIDAPRGCKYEGLTQYIVVRRGDTIPAQIGAWAQVAYDTAQQPRTKNE